MKKPPDHLSPGAKAAWNRLSVDPAYATLFGPTDMLSFEVLCENYAAWVDTKKAVEEFRADCLASRKKNADRAYTRQQNRELFGLNMNLKTAESALRYWLTSCGMTPPTRTRTSAPDEAPENEELELSDLNDEELEALSKVVGKAKAPVKAIVKKKKRKKR